MAETASTLENLGLISVMFEPSASFWRGRSVMITGGAGFIGSWLAYHLLRAGALVIVLDLKSSMHYLGGEAQSLINGVVFHQGTVCDRSLLDSLIKKNNVQTIFHLAAQAIVGEALKDPVEALESNVQGTWTVLEAVRQSGRKVEVVVASSDKAYGTHDILPYHEDFALQGVNPYDASKSCADLVATMYAKTYQMPLVITRCGNVYGGGDDNWSRLIPDTIRRLVHNQAPELRSDGRSRRDYVYIDDVVAAYCQVAEAIGPKNLQGEAFNFGNNEPKQALEVVQTLLALMGSKSEVRILATATHEIKDQYLDARKAKEILGWSASVDLQEGLNRTIAWYRIFFNEHPEYALV